MIEEIKALEATARALEPTTEERAINRASVIDYTESFLDNIDQIKAYETTKDKGIGIYDLPFQEGGRPIDELISSFAIHVDRPGLNPASGGHLGYIPGGGIYNAALGDYLADVTNRYAGVFFASPGAVRMENMSLQWMAKMVGYPTDAVGNHTSGGSIANLIAIVAARDAFQLKGADYATTVIYASAQMHHCLNKAIRIAGLSECIVRDLPLDDGLRIIPEALQKQIEADKAQGLTPFLVIASAGTTDVGAVDPLEAIGAIAVQHKLWYHVDGAYGAFFMLTPEGKEKLKGIELSDSVVMDPHKSLFLPYGSGVVLIKNRAALQHSHHYQANYMQDTFADNEEASPADLSPELTKHFRGLRLWLPLQLHGVAPFRACLEEKLLLTRYFHQKLSKTPGFEVGPIPDLSVATFRYIPSKGEVNNFNQRLVKLVQEDGRVFLSSTTIRGQFVIRLAVLAFRTHLDTIDLCIKVLNEKVKALETTL